MNEIFIFENNFQIAREKIRKNLDRVIIFSSDNDLLNRKILEKEKISFLLINLAGRNDKLKQLDSGFNHVLAKIAKKNNIGIGINLDEIIKSEIEEKSKIIARLMQNIKLCVKNKLSMKFFSPTNIKRNVHDLKGLGLSIGMPTWMVKDF